MKIITLTALVSLAVFSSACRTVVPVHPMTGQPALSMMPGSPADAASTGQSSTGSTVGATK